MKTISAIDMKPIIFCWHGLKRIGAKFGENWNNGLGEDRKSTLIIKYTDDCIIGINCFRDD